jgi:hypothetical protein
VTPSRFERLLARVFPYRDIVNDGDLYLRRYFLTPRSWPTRLFLHRIYRPDRDRDLHDHPWPFRTLVLRGGYEEEQYVPGLFERMGWLSTVMHWATYRHRITRVEPNTWTLCFVGQAQRTWGFWVDKVPHDGTSVFVPWREYLGLPNEPDSPEDA